MWLRLCNPVTEQTHKERDQTIDEMWGDRETKKDERAARTKLFDESNFGIFVHYGLYSELVSQWAGKRY